MSEDKWKNMPNAFRRRMAERNELEANDNEELQEEQNHELDVDDFVGEENHGAVIAGQDEVNDYDEEHKKLLNDLSSANGRLRKLEEENARLRVQAENGSFAARRLLEIQQEREQQQANQKQSIDDKSDDDFDESNLFDEIGEVGGKALLDARHKAYEASNEIAKLRQQLQEQQLTERRARFSQAVANQLPEIQTILDDENFISFLKNKTSFDGSSAFDFVSNVPNNLDIEKIPAVRALIDEYKQVTVKKQRKASSPPVQNKSIYEEDKPALKEWTQKDRAYLAKLMRQPNSKEKIAQFKAKFKKE